MIHCADIPPKWGGGDPLYAGSKRGVRSLLLLALVLLCPIWAVAQDKVTGTVVDETNEPLMGVTVRVPDSNIGAYTDIEGHFSINVKLGTKLVFSFVGYKTQTLAAKNGMTVKLEPDATTLGEVVVTGMVAQDKRLFTGATDKIEGNKVKLDGMSDVSRGLEGKSAGVSVQNISGTFGTAPKIRVRGATSIYGNSTPLWVVDGVIQENIVDIGPDDLSSGDAMTLISSAIAWLNPDDIESFQILKDGSATSIYGAKAMAGVIVITTKKGKEGTSSINYTGEFTTRLIPSYRTFNIMDSREQMGVYEELRQKGWLNFSDVYRASNSGVYGKMYQLTHSYNPETGQFGLENSEKARMAYLREAEMRNTDWFSMLFSSAIQQNHSVSIATGSKKSSSYASLSVMTDPGWMRSSGVSRYTANLNNSYDISDNLTFVGIANASYREQRAPGTIGQSSDAVSGNVSRSFDINPYSYALNTSRTLDPAEYYTRNFAPFNIFNELDNNHIDLDIVDMKFQGELNWHNKHGLRLGLLGAFKYNSVQQAHTITEYSNQALAYRAMDDATIIDRNGWLYKDPDKPNELPQTVLPKGGFYNKDSYRMVSYDLRATAQYNTVLDEVHIINTFGGAELNSQDRRSDWSEGWGMQYDNGELPFFNYLAFKQMRERNANYYGLNNTHSRQLAFFGTATYSYAGRYTINGTLRYEGTNRLGRSRSARWLPTWNISGAWNAHEEEWFDKLSPALSHLTLKGSYSLTADAGPAWVTNSQVVIGSYNPWRPTASAGESGLQIRDLENRDLTYEKKHELNLGADVGFLDNRINLAVDWYTRNNYDLIGYITTQGTGGKVDRLGNVATMMSHGTELTLSTRNISTEDFSWTTDFIFGYAKTEVTDLETRNYLFSFVSGNGFTMEGYPHRAIFSIPFTGLDEDGYPTFHITDRNGEELTVNKNNYGDIDFQQRTNLEFLKYEGPSEPTITGSFGNTFEYKNWRLNVFITYSAGNKLRLDPVFHSWYSDLDATPKDFKNRWTNIGDEEVTDVPVIIPSWDSYTYGNLNLGYNAYNYSTARVANGDFIRLKELSLQYSLPQSVLEGLLLKSASFKIQGTNLFLLYADKKLNGQDPEFFRAGGVSAPVPKQFTLTVRLGF